MSTFQILHISDLHINKEDDFNRNVVLNPLIERIEKDRKLDFNPEIVVVTGDIAYKGKSSGYAEAKKFLDILLSALSLKDGQLFIVPGNHDVDRRKLSKGLVPRYSEMEDLNDDIGNEELREDLFKGLENYFWFVEEHYKHLKSEHPKLVPFVEAYPAKCRKKIGLVGLNSAWMCRKSTLDEGRIAIGEQQIVKATEELKKKGKCDYKIFFFHHPPKFLWDKDRKICMRYFDNEIMLFGHAHDVGAGFIADLLGNSYQFQAGGIYRGKDTQVERFQYLTLDWDAEEIRLDLRVFNRENRTWCVDSLKGKDGTATFPMLKAKTTALKADVKKIVEQDRIFENYTESALIEHRHLPTQGFETNVRISIELERVYVNMRAYIQSREFEYSIDGKTRMLEKIREERLTTLDIKAAFEAAQKHHIKDMVILGDPGSGKTTLLKYILVMLILARAEEKIGLRSDTIPFFVPLRELKDPGSEEFFPFIKRVCRLDKFSIPEEAFRTLLDSGRGIMLLDGLDEVADEKARIKTCKWIDENRKLYARTPFVVTSRFAGYVGQSRLEGNCLELSVQDFEDDEVEAFLVRWFEAVESILHAGEDDTFWKDKGRKDAQVLFKRIKESEHIRKLAVRPLLLQIISLVHRDRGTLPQRRVELYEECTNVMLEKWDMAKGLEGLITAREARQVLQPLALWLHGEDERRSAPMGEIAEVIKNPLQEIGKSGIDPETLLLNIRDRSGIFMGYSESEYGFTHLSFQEYMAAEQIRNMGNIEMLIQKYGEDWWKEVILLCLALDNPSVIEEFMRRIIPTDRFKTDISLIFDAIGDSIKKPLKPIADVLTNDNLALEARNNAIRVLKRIGGDSAIQALREAAGSKDRALARFALEALVSLDAAEGIEKPVEEEIPRQVISKIDDATMVLIPVGTFLYGSREDDKVAHSDEKPQRVIDLPAFYIDVFPVTNEQYSRFLSTEHPSKKTLENWIDLEGYQCRIKQSERIYTCGKGYEKHPVTNVSWHGADAYAKWTGKRLPTEQEWEKAARGIDGGIYPWGDEFKKDLCNSSESSIDGTSEVDRFPEGKSPYGCFDMAGNVWEWTDSWYDEDKNTKVLRGGSWYDVAGLCRCAVRDSFDPIYWYGGIGFRCART